MNETLTSTSEHLHRFPQEMTPAEAAMEYLREYAKERPEVIAMWCFGIGFVLGWKLKPW
jgi:hypothetical protein